MVAVEDLLRQRAAAVPIWLRPIGMVIAIGCLAGAMCSSRIYHQDGRAWWLLGVGLAVAVLAQRGLLLNGTAPQAAPTAATSTRLVLGSVLALAGAALWGWASHALYLSWNDHFDAGWAGWVGAAVLLSVGLDLLWGRWSQRGETHVEWRRPAVLVLALLAIAAVYRLGNIASFPGEGHISQVEDLQTGMWGLSFAHGGRARWEYLSHEWLAGLGIWLGGPTLLAMRIPFAVVSTLKLLPLFLWVRFAVGMPGALVATALFACARWDVVLSRIPNNQNALIVASAFALLAGPVRRGRPSAYVWLGLFGGYVFYEYVAYRPLILFILIGVTALSLQDRGAHWRARVARPLITLALIVAMGCPLFLRMTNAGFSNEYMNGWNRAKVQGPYYDSNDTWAQFVAKRINRSSDAVALFFFHGEGAAVHNINGAPLIDPVTATLMVLGIAYGLAHWPRSIFGLTVFAFGVTLAGTLVATGNFDVGRVGGSVPYAFALAGYGASSIVAAWGTAWGRSGKRAAITLLTAATLVAGYQNTRFLLDFWSSPTVRGAYRNDLSAVTGWVRSHIRPGERIAGVAPGYFNVLEPNDAAWLRGGDIPGVLAWDFKDALRDWDTHRGAALLLAFAGASGRDAQQYLEWLFPGVKLQFETVDPAAADSGIAFVHLPEPPAVLHERVATAHCRGVHSEYDLINTAGDGVVFHISTVDPFIDPTTWPSEVRNAAYRQQAQASQIRVRYDARFVAPAAGEYRFTVDLYAGQVKIEIDGQPVTYDTPVSLTEGPHTFAASGSFAVVVQPHLRLWWRGPGADAPRNLVPFYRLAEPDPSCTPPLQAAADGATAGAER